MGSERCVFKGMPAWRDQGGMLICMRPATEEDFKPINNRQQLTYREQKEVLLRAEDGVKRHFSGTLNMAGKVHVAQMLMMHLKITVSHHTQARQDDGSAFSVRKVKAKAEVA